MAMLEVHDLHTSFFTPAGEVKAVNGLSFNLEQGKVLGIVGESGSGKSVTAYSILQILGDSLRGAGKVKQPMYIIMINICMIRTCLLFLIAPRVRNVRGVAVTYPITWALTAVCMTVYYMKFHRKLRKEEIQER